MPPGHQENSALALALDAVDAVQADPERARTMAESLLDRGDISPEASAVARWALGLVARQLNDLGAAQTWLDAALALAIEHDLDQRQGEIRSSLSLVLLYQGDTDGALAEANRAGALLTGVAAARNDMQRALILQRLGHLDDALVRYRGALRGFRRAGDRIAEARLLVNRGVLHGYRGEIGAGIADLEHAAGIAEELGQHLIAAAAAHNLGFLEGRRGDVPAALGWFDAADRAYAELGSPAGMVEQLQANRAELLLAAGLVDEADRVIREAVARVEELGNQTDLAELLLVAADAALQSGDREASESWAASAVEAFRAQRRPRWELYAEYVVARARIGHRGEPGDLVELAQRLATGGFVAESRHLVIQAGRLALDRGDLDRAGSLLDGVASASSHGTAIGRSQAWYAAALLRSARGNTRGAWRAIDAGLGVLGEYRATFGAAELRAHSAGHGLDLVRLALDLAVDAGNPARAFRAVETWRGLAGRLPPVRPENDDEVQSALERLRAAHADERQAALAGDDPRDARRRRLDAERRVREIMRIRRGAEGAAQAVDVGSLTDHMNHETLVSFFRHGDEIRAIVVDGRRCRMVALGPAADVAMEVNSTVFSLHRLAGGRASEASQDAAATALAVSSGTLSDRLIAPLGLGDGPLVVVPTGALHRLPWMALPALAGRPITVVPSAAAWMKARKEAFAAAPAVLVAGPGLAGAIREVDVLRRAYPDAIALTGDDASAAAVIEAMEGAGVVHLAAHGRFRSDNALFSSLQMADGPLTVYDLERLRQPPSLVVMPSCDTAVSDVVHGDEVLGLSAALLGLGARGLVAPVVPIADDATVGVMLALHDGLRRGLGPSAALVSAAAPMPDDTRLMMAVKSAFVAMGA